MSNKKTDISQIKKYLQNELDNQAMHQLERKAQEDPFFAEAMEGFENVAVDQDANYADLRKRLSERIEPAKERNIWLWRVLPLAACLLIALLIGYQYLLPKRAQKQQLANVIKPEPELPKADTVRSAEQPVATLAAPEKKQFLVEVPQKPRQDTAVTATASNDVLQALAGKVAGVAIYKADTVEYKASNYTVRTNAPVADVLKKVPGIQVDSAGNVTTQGQAVAKVRINGKDFVGGSVQQAIKNLPADIIDKIQVVDDYGDQASKTGIKNGDPNKVLNISTADSTKKNRIANNEISDKALNEVVIVRPQQLARQRGRLTPSTPVGGQKSFDDYLTKNAVADAAGLVEVGFTPADNGIPENVHIINSDNESLNNKALDLISHGPKWKKGTDGKEVRVKINFHKP